MIKKNTVVVGASPNSARYSYRAIEMLAAADHPVKAEGLRDGEVAGITISKEKKPYEDVDTVTLYVGPRNQVNWSDYIKSLNPKRVIFNPGTENPEFENDLEKEGIETERACTLVLLSMGAY